MEKIDFPNPKLNLPKEWKINSQRQNSFDAIENYLELVSGYIHTEIALTNSDANPHAWILKLVSESLIRSLYLRNAFVEAVNTRNFPSIFIQLKAWFEVVGLLASLLRMLNQNISESDLMDKIMNYALGNRGDSESRVGTVEAVSVMTMLDNANKYLKKKLGFSEDFFRYFYDIASNPSHPSFDAHALVGGLVDEVWFAKDSDSIKQEMVKSLESFGGLLMTPLYICMLCEDIFEFDKIQYVAKICPKYFN